MKNHRSLSKFLLGFGMLCLACVAGASEEFINHYAPLKTHAFVTEVAGSPQYAYQGTGWQALKTGKILKPGAIVRAAAGSSAVLKVATSDNFIKVAPGTNLYLTPETPTEEVKKISVAGK
jgi:hypothetical protein